MAKKKAGQQKVNNVKSSNFLPSVFQTELNKSWLDSTLDQMVSKGPLDNIDGYIGSKHGNVAKADDVYIESQDSKTQLTPALVSYDKQKQLTNSIAFDDIANSINTNFATYNYNSAYSSDRYTFNPPVDIDKFVNHTNYRWVPELPVYESIWTGTSKNPITDIQTNGISILTDDNNTFTVENQMLIKFTGSGWDASVLNKTYIVAGSVGKHKLYEYLDASGNRVYNNTVSHSEDADGVWWNGILHNAELNTSYSGYQASSVESPQQLVDHYNNDITGNKLPYFSGFNFPQLTSNSTKLIKNTLVKFTGTWTHTGITNSTDIFSLTIDDTTGDVSIAAATSSEIASANTTLSPDNNLMYNEGYPIDPQRDYIVIAKDDSNQTAWSRANHWVNISTIKKLQELIPTYDFTEIKNAKRKAQRPIIEYNAELHLWDTQTKTKINQYPLYKFFNTEGESLEGGCNKSFTGEKIFGYKEGTGTNDTELGFPLSYKDTPKGAEYEFENFILTHEYYTNHSNAEYSKATYSKEQLGYNFFKQNNVLKTIYTPAGISAGAWSTAQYKVNTIDAALEIPYGSDNFKLNETFFLHKIDNNISISVAYSNGTTSTMHTGNAELYTICESDTIEFNNLTDITSTEIKVISNGVDIESTSIPEITFTRTGDKITLVTSGSSDGKQFNVVHDDGSTVTVLQSFIIDTECNKSFYKIQLNGANIDPSKVTINATTISIDESILAMDDLVDFSWRSNDLTNETTNISLPDVHIHNSSNSVIKTFTMSETINHWTDKLNSMPGFDITLTDNNYASIPHTTQYGGTIFVHENNTTMHDINYSNKKATITGALLEQGKEFNAFRTRVSSQARRLFTLGTSSVQQLTDDAITEINRNKQKNTLYNTSNMLYGELPSKQQFSLEGAISTFPKTFKTRFTFNGDTNIRDHVYVYLTENNGSDKQIRRLLLKDRDYRFLSNTVEILIDYAALDSNLTEPKLEVYHIKMDEASFVPPSMVKLGLAYGVEPQVNNGILYTHDGKEISVTDETSLIDLDSTTFDPVNAVVYEMEKRIYAGLVKEDYMYSDEKKGRNRFNSPVEHLPPNIGTWYKLNDLNNYLEKYYYKWARLNNITSLNTDNYYDVADPFTWNYSTLSLGSTTMPGHWKGAYTHIFGTCTPHITPWHMLGYGFKPTWWDTHYSWTDATKRTALINALTNGIVSNPSSNTIQVLRNARYTWDWASKCPVKTDGTLEDPDTVLGTPSNVDKEQDFVFGDWGPVEAQWRLSAEGQAVLLDAVLKLNPAKAWTDFFQPGAIDSYKSVIKNINHYTQDLINTKDFKIPGKIYESSIYSLKLKTTSQSNLEKDGYFNIIDDDQSTFARARYVLNDISLASGSTDSLSLIERGLNFTGHPIVSYAGSDSVTNSINVDIKLKQIPFTANGIAQAQYNYLIRNSIDINLEDLYTKLETKLQVKVNGFTDKHLLNLSSETSTVGDLTLGAEDFNVSMYEGSLNELVTASSVLITKTVLGYKVEGFNNNTREFKFYEPNIDNPTDYITKDINGQTLRRYNKFVTVPSIVEYDAQFSKKQDMYNFVRGYWKWMETQGYTPQNNSDVASTDFINWAVTAEVNDSTILHLGQLIQYKPATGHVYEFNTLEYNSNDILSTDHTRIDNSKLGIKRIDGIVSIETKDNEFIGSTTSAVLNYEHIIILENKTKLGVTIYDDIKSNSLQRLTLTGQRTLNWTGEKKAPGYLIVNDSIVQNFDSAVQSVDNIYRTDVDEFNLSFSKSKDLTIGNIEGQMLDGLGINKNVLTNYYQGMIKEKGTKGAIEHVGKSNILHKAETTVSAYEQYMFRQTYLGNNDFEAALEIELKSSDINSSPQVITLDSTSTVSNVIKITDDRVVNSTGASPLITFEEVEYDDANLDILTGGEALIIETDYQILNSNEISSVFDSTADYATIPTWSPTVSYKKGDQVRFRGHLWKCKVDFTGLDVVSPTIEATTPLATDQNILTYGTVASIDGTVTTIQRTREVYNDIVATGSSFTPFLESETLEIGYLANMTPITFSKQESIQTVIGPATIKGEAGPISFSDVTGKAITINIRNTASNGTVTDNNTVVNFDTTPGNVVENITGVAAQQTYTISQALSGSTYSVSSVTVDGTANTDFTISGQDITFNTPTFAGSEAIVVTLVHIPNQMSAEDIKDHINNAGITNLTASLETAGAVEVLQLSYQDADIGNQLVLEAGSTNNDLGFITSPINQQIVSSQLIQGVITPTNLTVEEVRDQINATANLAAQITASVSGGNIVLTDTDGSVNLAISGTARTKLGLETSYSTSTSTENRSATYAEAVADIQATLTAQSISGVSVVLVGNAIKFESTNSSLNLGDTDFNSQTGLQTGIIYAAEGDIDNDWDTEHYAYFDPIVDDPALYNILIADDSDFEIESFGDVVTKFWGWNVLQVTQRRSEFTKVAGNFTVGIEYKIQTVGTTDFTLIGAANNNVGTIFTATGVGTGDGTATYLSNTNLYSLPSASKNAETVLQGGTATTCGICAGLSSKDGNDAEITTNFPHGLQVGDYVQLLNTDTTPTIDGIHKVTKIDTNDAYVFYIDEFIEKCGNAQSIMPLVTTRFKNKDQRGDTASTTVSGAEDSRRWNIPVGALTFVNNVDGVRGTFVEKKTATTPTYESVRTNTTRPTNKDIDSVIIYNQKTNQSKVQLEVWDPMRKIIPGIAERNLDYINFSDNAIYSTSTDESHLTDEDNAWGTEQLGTRWWDTSRARYYDYDQGNSNVQARSWGYLYPGAEIAVWEWIKSSVAPDDYADAVTESKEMFGIVATGEAYFIYDSVAKENVYYYTTEKEYNSDTGNYNDVYYFWVKNKTTTTDTRTLSALDVANIIENPSANGVSWFAVTNNNSFIVSNINYYLEDENTVLQINKAGNKFNSHNEWMMIAKDKDLIPEYYFNSMKRSFSGINPATSETIPYSTLHRFNSYGNDMDIGQTWFNDLPGARRNAVVTLNEIFKNINLNDVYKNTWDKTFIANKFPTLLWEWIDYKLETYNGTYNHTKTITAYSDLNTIDRDFHSVVKLIMFDEVDELDRSETYAYNNESKVWELVLKKNNTIKLDEGLLSAIGGWDKNAWDSNPWDFADISSYWLTLLDALRDDIFVGYYRNKMNTFFFSVIHYILSSFNQTNWIRKTTYIKLEFTGPLKTDVRKYTKNKISNVLGYIQEVKPFHTKSSTVLTSHTNIDEVGLTVTETPQTVISIKPSAYDGVFGKDRYSGGDFTTDHSSTDIYAGGDFTTDHSSTDTYSGPDFTEAELFNYTVDGHNRNSLVEVKPLELLRINVQTNASGSTHANDSLTFAHIQDYSGYVNAYALTESKETTLTSPLTLTDTTISIASTTAFSNVGIAYIKGELIEYSVVDATTLGITKRELAGTFKVLASTGDSIVDVTNSKLTFANEDPSHYQYNTLSDTILNSPGSTQAQELQSLGKGIEL